MLRDKNKFEAMISKTGVVVNKPRVLFEAIFGHFMVISLKICEKLENKVPAAESGVELLFKMELITCPSALFNLEFNPLSVCVDKYVESAVFP